MMDEQGGEAATAPLAPLRLGYVAGAIVGAVALALLGAWFALQQHQLDAMRAINRASFERRIAAANLLGGLAQAESAQRGFVLTGDARLLAVYQASRPLVAAEQARLGGLYAGDVAEQARLARLHALVATKFGEMDEVVGLRRSRGVAAAVARVADGQGVGLMTQARTLVTALARSEEVTLNRHLDQVRGQYAAVNRLVWVLMLVAVLALWGGLWLVWRAQAERHRSELAAHQAAAGLRAIFASTTDAIVILDAEGRVQQANAAVGRMLGYAEAELVGRDVSALLDIAPGEGAFAERVGLDEQGLAQPNRLDRDARHSDGHTVPVDVALGVMALPGGPGVVAAIRDISDRKAVERLKDEFVSTVSHELRTPLTSVVGSLGLLRGGAVGELPDAARRLVEIAENNSRRLIRLINDILDIEKIGSGRMHFDTAPIDLPALLARAVEGGGGLAEAKGVRLALDAAGPLTVHGDADRLLQVVGNLLSNAVRFSPDGGTVHTRVARENGQAVVTVDDEGPGIPPAFRGRIFERFAQGGDGAQRSGGTGLGLAISREIVAAHGGRIWFGQAPGGGARLAFALPLPPEAAADGGGADARILVFEPQEPAARLLRETLEGHGCRIDCVETAGQAEAAARSGRYDGLIVGLGSGDRRFELVRALRRRADTRTLPIIMVSAVSGTEPEQAEAAALEMVDWIDKPVDQQRLVDAVRRAIAHSAATRPTLLHVDDDVELLEVTATALADQGRMLRATGVAAARDMLVRHPPDIVILDVALPDGSGLELLPELLAADGGAVPTIIYSATDVVPEVEAQVDAVLVKSRRSLPSLATTIRRLLAEKQGEAA